MHFKANDDAELQSTISHLGFRKNAIPVNGLGKRLNTRVQQLFIRPGVRCLFDEQLRDKGGSPTGAYEVVSKMLSHPFAASSAIERCVAHRSHQGSC